MKDATRIEFFGIYLGVGSGPRGGLCPFEHQYHEFATGLIQGNVKWWTEKPLSYEYGEAVRIRATITDKGTIQRPKFEV